LLSVINDILDFSKIEAGRFTLDTAEFAPDEMLPEVVRMVAVGAHRKGLELLYDVEGVLPPALLGDTGRLRQILINLLGNAIKFTESGEVSLRVAVEQQKEGSATLHFAVSDTGVGISPKWQSRIFEAFVQADGSNTRRFGGTGLGLAISSRLVKLMGGRIWVESKVNKGSTFHVTVDFQVSSTPAANLRPATPASLHGLAVLVVDDNATNRRILYEMLVKWRMRPTLAESGPKALEILRERQLAGDHFALVLLDAQMPEMDGFTVARRIQEDPTLVGPRIMMLSSVDVKISGPELRASGLAHYVVKPVTREGLLKAILRVLGERREHHVVAGNPSGALPGRSLRILLAEDNLVNQKVAVFMLKNQGHSVTVAATGAEAVEAFTRNTFDLILMDAQMPVMNGYEATHAIRASEHGTGQHIPIIALTASAMKGDREICLEAGMDDYLSKPISQQHLKEMLDRWSQTQVPIGM
jgi:CheY-like chemotaxis protein